MNHIKYVHGSSDNAPVGSTGTLSLSPTSGAVFIEQLQCYLLTAN